MMFARSHWRLCPVISAWFALLLCGCERVEVTPMPGQPSVDPATSNADIGVDEKNASDQGAGDQPAESFEAQSWIDPESLPLDSWYTQYMNGRRIGFFHIEVAKGESLFRVRRTAFMDLQRGNQKLRYQSVLESLEYPSGRLASFTESTTVDGVTNQVEGQIEGSRLVITTTDADGESERKTVTWRDGSWGVLGVHSMLLNNPMKPGDKRSGHVFIPQLGKILPIDLTAGEESITTLTGGATPKLCPVDVVITDDEQLIRSRNWIDNTGAILKTTTLDGPTILTFRTPEDLAIRIADEYRLTGLLERTVPLEGPLPPANAQRAVYSVEGSNLDFYAIWSKNVRQTVASTSALSAEVTVHDLTRPETLSKVKPDEPIAHHSAASALIQSDHADISDMASRHVTDELSREETALKLAQVVAQEIKLTELSANKASARETLRRRQGDFVDRSFLLVALLRNQQIPARVAAGIKLNAEKSAFEFYMWSEAWLDDHWLPLDSVTGAIPSAHCLKLEDSAMNDANPYGLMFRVFDRMQYMKLRWIVEN